MTEEPTRKRKYSDEDSGHGSSTPASPTYPESGASAFINVQDGVGSENKEAKIKMCFKKIGSNSGEPDDNFVIVRKKKETSINNSCCNNKRVKSDNSFRNNKTEKSDKNSFRNNTTLKSDNNSIRNNTTVKSDNNFRNNKAIKLDNNSCSNNKAKKSDKSSCSSNKTEKDNNSNKERRLILQTKKKENIASNSEPSKKRSWKKDGKLISIWNPEVRNHKDRVAVEGSFNPMISPEFANRYFVFCRCQFH